MADLKGLLKGLLKGIEEKTLEVISGHTDVETGYRRGIKAVFDRVYDNIGMISAELFAEPEAEVKVDEPKGLPPMEPQPLIPEHDEPLAGEIGQEPQPEEKA